MRNSPISNPPGQQRNAVSSDVRGFGILPEEARAFDLIVQTVALACGSSALLLGLANEGRHVIQSSAELLDEEDAAELASIWKSLAQAVALEQDVKRAFEPRLVRSPTATGRPALWFLAGAPLQCGATSCAGVLCVLGESPRELKAGQLDIVLSLAALAGHAIQMRAALIDRMWPKNAAVSSRWASSNEPGGPLAPTAAAQAEDLLQSKVLEAGDRGCSDVIDDNFAYALLHGLRRDVGKSTQAVGTVQSSRQLLDRTGEVAGVGGWALDLRTSQITWSEQTRRIHEVEANYVPTLDSAIAFYAPGSRQVIKEAVEEGQRTGRPWDLELRLVTQRGRQIWVRAVGEVVFERGSPVRMSGALQDVTERKNLERSSARLSTTLRAVLESVSANVSVVDREGIFQFANGNFERWLGRSRDQILGCSLLEVLGPVEFERSQPWIERVRAGETVTFEKDYGQSDRARWSITYIPLWSEHGQTEGFVQVASTIHQHRLEDGPSMRAGHRDKETGLLNRAGFVDYLERQATGGVVGALAVLCIEISLPTFEALIPNARRKVLGLFAQRLGGLVRSSDAVARLSERQFSVVLKARAACHEAKEVGAKIAAAAAQPFAVGSDQLKIGVVVGAAWGARPGQSWVSLLAKADVIVRSGVAVDADAHAAVAGVLIHAGSDSR